MTNTEIKKALYKQKPTATLEGMRSTHAAYTTKLEDGTIISFNIPYDDMGEAWFYSEMDAKILNRWIVNETISG